MQVTQGHQMGSLACPSSSGKTPPWVWALVPQSLPNQSPHSVHLAFQMFWDSFSLSSQSSLWSGWCLYLLTGLPASAHSPHPLPTVSFLQCISDHGTPYVKCFMALCAFRTRPRLLRMGPQPSSSISRLLPLCYLQSPQCTLHSLASTSPAGNTLQRLLDGPFTFNFLKMGETGSWDTRHKRPMVISLLSPCSSATQSSLEAATVPRVSFQRFYGQTNPRTHMQTRIFQILAFHTIRCYLFPVCLAPVDFKFLPCGDLAFFSPPSNDAFLLPRSMPSAQ